MPDPTKSSGNSRSESALRRTRIAYLENPDYSNPLLEILPDFREQTEKRLTFLYGDTIGKKSMPELERILKVHYAHDPKVTKEYPAADINIERIDELLNYNAQTLTEKERT